MERGEGGEERQHGGRRREGGREGLVILRNIEHTNVSHLRKETGAAGGKKSQEGISVQRGEAFLFFLLSADSG